jgi:hypothetical protein
VLSCTRQSVCSSVAELHTVLDQSAKEHHRG